MVSVGQAEAPKEAKKEEGGGFFGFGKKEAPKVEAPKVQSFFLFFFTLVTGPRRSSSLKLSDTGVYEPQKVQSLALYTSQTRLFRYNFGTGQNLFRYRRLPKLKIGVNMLLQA